MAGTNDGEFSAVRVGGAYSSHIAPAFHRIPECALRRLAARFSLGSRYDDPQKAGMIPPVQNWQQGDAEFFVDRLNHGIEHLYKWISGDRSEDHLAAVAWMAFALMWAEENGIIK